MLLHVMQYQRLPMRVELYQNDTVTVQSINGLRPDDYVKD
jgi:hypothetical protein